MRKKQDAPAGVDLVESTLNFHFSSFTVRRGENYTADIKLTAPGQRAEVTGLSAKNLRGLAEELNDFADELDPLPSGTQQGGEA